MRDSVHGGGNGVGAFLSRKLSFNIGFERELASVIQTGIK